MPADEPAKLQQACLNLLLVESAPRQGSAFHVDILVLASASPEVSAIVDGFTSRKRVELEFSDIVLNGCAGKPVHDTP